MNTVSSVLRMRLFVVTLLLSLFAFCLVGLPTAHAGVWTLTIELEPTQGTVTTSDGRTCESASCSYSLSYGSPITIYANPKTGYVFDHWSGDCQDKSGSSCMINTGNPSALAGTYFRSTEPETPKPSQDTGTVTAPTGQPTTTDTTDKPDQADAAKQELQSATTVPTVSTPDIETPPNNIPTQTTHVAKDTNGTDYKVVIGLIAVLISIIGYIPYYRDILRGRTKPHAFSWLVWALLNGIAFAGQLHDKGGPGAWALGLTAAALSGIFILALFRGERDIRQFDWYCLAGSGIALAAWFTLSGPLVSVVLITIVDAFGFLPTARKAYARPHQETLITYVINTAKYCLIVLALEHYTTTTLLFPLAVALMNAAFVAMLLIRRHATKLA